MLDCDALFLSDLHVGSNQCEARDLSQFLQRIRPRTLYLVGDILDLPAIRLNAGCDESVIAAAVTAALEGGLEGLLETGRAAGRRLLRPSHRQVLQRLRDLQAGGVRLVYIPGNHDGLLRRHAGLQLPGFSIQLEHVYDAPDGRRLLVRHGDEYDRLIRLHAGIASSLMRLQEHYSGWVNGARQLLLPARPPGTGGWTPEAILEAAGERLASHWDWPIPTHRGLDASGEFSLAFALESALKSRTGHDRLIKRMMAQHLWRENRAGRRLDGVVNGHTHIPEATACAWPQPWSPGDGGPCHITYYNDGSWARSQRRLGRTALVVAHNGTVGMVRFARRHGIEPFQPPRFAFNTYPSRLCDGCGQPVACLSGSG